MLALTAAALTQTTPVLLPRRSIVRAPLRAERGRLLSVPDFAKGCADAELCACAALQLGWMRAARALLRSSDRKFGSRLRELAQSRVNEAKNFLVRLHPKYPAHIKAVPALLWAQTSETLHVRVRLSRYPGGEYTMRRASPLVVNCTADGLFFSAEGDDVAAYFSTTVRWWAPLLAATASPPRSTASSRSRRARQRRGGGRGCSAARPQTASNTPTSSSRASARCARARRMADADSRECGGLCADARASQGEREIEDADERDGAYVLR